MKKGYMFEKGSMIESKKLLGVFFLISGGGLIFAPDQIASFFGGHQDKIFGMVMIFGGYLLSIAGRRR